MLRWSVLHEPAFHTGQDFDESICFSFSVGPGDSLRLCTKRFLFNFKSIKYSIMTCGYIDVVQTVVNAPNGTDRLCN